MSTGNAVVRDSSVSALSMLTDDEFAVVVLAVATVRSTRGDPRRRRLYDRLADAAISLSLAASKGTPETQPAGGGQ